MKRSLLLLGLLPAVVLANAIRQPEPAPAKVVKPSTAAHATKTPKERWQNVAKADDASFRRHVVPLMSRAGCSGRECHGSFQGRGGFQLSLFGYDFEKDHVAITQGKGGAEEVRVDLKEPVRSLVLAKPALDGEEHKEQMRQYESRRAEVDARKAELQRMIAESEKSVKPFNVDDAIAEAFLRTLSRPPSAVELTQARADVAAAKSPLEGVRDLLWAMLNTREFMVNH